MQIVINIDENVFTRLFNNGTEDYAIVNDDLFAIAKSICKGTLLPKGHGRLFDEIDIVNGNYEIIGNKIYEVEPIIEADTESEEQV